MKIDLTIPRRVLQSLAKIASKDAIRYILNGFNVRSLNGFKVMTATNGVHLVSIQLDFHNGEDFDIILPAFLPPPSRVDYVVEVDTETKTATYLHPGYTTVHKLIDGNYPNFLHCVPSETSGQGKIVFNLSKIELIIASAKLYSPKGSIFITPNQTNAAVVAITDSPEWFGMLMPINHQSSIDIPAWIKPKTK